MDLYSAIRTLQAAAYNWCEYLGENDREAEAEIVDSANDTIDKLLELF